jgi:hypothetical protein
MGVETGDEAICPFLLFVGALVTHRQFVTVQR